MKRGLLAIGLTAVVAFTAACEGESTGGAKTGYLDARATGGISIGGSSSGLCVERYSSENLRKRELAFDGTVKSIRPAEGEQGSDELTFTVNEWYKGGSGEEVTLKSDGLVAITPDSPVRARVGARMLVSGDDGFAFICDFTQTYTPALAAEWKAALG